MDARSLFMVTYCEDVDVWVLAQSHCETTYNGAVATQDL